MPLVSSRELLAQARKKRYGIPSLLAGNLELVVGPIMAAEERKSPLILPFNQEVTPKIPMEIGIPLAVNAAERASVPVAVILDHGKSLEDALRAIRLGASSVMFDGSNLPYEENVRQTREVVRVAHALGACVEAELGGISNYSVDFEESGPEGSVTDPHLAVDFVEKTGIDTLAISFGNAHGVYRGEPNLDLDRVRQIPQLNVVSRERHQHALQGVLQLADVARPGVTDQRLPRLGAELLADHLVGQG